MKWELRHIQCLVAISEAGTITDAALELGISQPQVSRVLRTLEASWGVQLVVRSSRRTTLTSEGRLAVERGRHLLAFADSIESAVRGDHMMRLGYIASAAGRHTPALQRKWREVEPDVDLRLIHAQGALGGMAEGLTDAAVLRRAPDPTTYQSTVVGTEQLVTACADNDLWGRRRSVKLKEFAGRPLVVNSRSDLDLNLWPGGFGPLRAFDVEGMDQWLDAIAAGRGVGVATRATAEQHRPIGVRYAPINDAPRAEVRLCWPRGHSLRGLHSLEGILRDLYSSPPRGLAG
ncbi:LysR family transcriptional regulator [Nesterenkonia sphaerica]|nr:LysR family transcriptional regulator [Nesterenkonia sphaerica]